MVWICCAWRVLFSTWYNEELVLAPVFLGLIAWALPCPFPTAFSPLLLLQWFAYCSSREMYSWWSICYVQNEFTRDTFPWCSWSQVYRNENVIWVGFFFSVDHFSAAIFSMTLNKTRKDEICIYVFLVLIPSSSRAWQIHYRWDEDKQWLETWLRNSASV